MHAPYECKTCLLRFCERCNTENKRCVCRFHVGYLSEEEPTDSDVSVDDPFPPEFQVDDNASLAIQSTKDSARLKKAEERQRILQEDQDECERLQVTRLLTKFGFLGGPGRRAKRVAKEVTSVAPVVTKLPGDGSHRMRAGTVVTIDGDKNSRRRWCVMHYSIRGLHHLQAIQDTISLRLFVEPSKVRHAEDEDL